MFTRAGDGTRFVDSLMATIDSTFGERDRALGEQGLELEVQESVVMGTRAGNGTYFVDRLGTVGELTLGHGEITLVW